MFEDDIGFTTAVELARCIRNKEISPVELIEVVLRRTEVIQAALNPFITITDDIARTEAKIAEKAVMNGDDLGPIHGVPFTVKDLVNTAGVTTTFGSFAFEDNVPKIDSIGVARLRRAGGIFNW